MQQRIDSKRALYRFDSVREFAAWLERTPQTALGARYNSSQCTSHEYMQQSWCLGLTYKDAEQMAFKGWHEGAKQVQRKLAKFAPIKTAPRKLYAPAGHMVHMGRYTGGDPACMIRKNGDQRNGQVVALYIDVCISASVNAEYTANYAVAVAQYVKQLHIEGTPCEVHLTAATRNAGRDQCMSVCIKRAAQPLDLATLAAAFHPAFFRRLWFAFQERGDVKLSIGYGSIRKVTPEVLINPVAGAYFIDGFKRANQNARTIEQALESLEAEIARKRTTNEKEAA